MASPLTRSPPTPLTLGHIDAGKFFAIILHQREVKFASRLETYVTDKAVQRNQRPKNLTPMALPTKANSEPNRRLYNNVHEQEEEDFRDPTGQRQAPRNFYLPFTYVQYTICLCRKRLPISGNAQDPLPPHQS
ncbi:unnamed protein product [Ectocarpus sp. 8 AP-2014]